MRREGSESRLVQTQTGDVQRRRCAGNYTGLSHSSRNEGFSLWTKKGVEAVRRSRSGLQTAQESRYQVYRTVHVSSTYTVQSCGRKRKVKGTLQVHMVHTIRSKQAHDPKPCSEVAGPIPMQHQSRKGHLTSGEAFRGPWPHGQGGGGRGAATWLGMIVPWVVVDRGSFLVTCRRLGMVCVSS